MPHLVTISTGPQVRRGAQRAAQQLLGHVAAVDVGLVQGRDALLEAGLDLGLDMGGRGVGVVAEPPHPVDRRLKVRPGRSRRDPWRPVAACRATGWPKGLTAEQMPRDGR
jgi:hypothetical protein